MEYLPNGMTLEIPDGCFPLSTDSMVLAWFAAIRGQKQVLDLGSGCGTLGLLLCAQNDALHVTGMELDSCAHEAARENICRNQLDARMESICGDLRKIPERITPGSFDCALSNPPYFSGGPAASLTEARREDCCTLRELITGAAWALKYGGDFYLVHRPERLGEILGIAAEKKLEAKRLGLVRHKAGGPVALVLLQLRKGGKPGLRWEEIILHHADGTETDLYKEIYHIT